jgi:hypothetical protein
MVLLLAAATLIFGLQNLQNVSLDFLWFSMNAPLAFVVAATYVAGMVTGSSFLALIRRSARSTGMSRFASLMLALVVVVLIGLAVTGIWVPFGRGAAE